MSLVDLRHLSSPQAAALAREAIGVVMVGAVEQHGPHLPLGTDSFITNALVRGVADLVAVDVVAAPPVFVGRSDHHLTFPGTVSLPPDVMNGVLGAHVAGLVGLGLARVALFSAHGGNFAALGAFAEGYRGPARVRAYADFGRFLAVMARAGADAGLVAPATDSHAGAYETSMVLALLGPGAVDDFSDVQGYTAAEEGWLERLQTGRIEDLSPTGVIGRPDGANAEAGRRILDALAAELADWMTGAFALERPSSVEARP